jgi:anti-sigma-K factor RskA
MNEHEQFAEDLALHALGSLAGHERIALEKHLQGCSACRIELEHLCSDTALLALSAAGPMPPQRARQRLMNAVKREPRFPVGLPSGRPIRWWSALAWAAAAAMVIAVAFLWSQNQNLAQQIARLKSDENTQQEQLAQAKEIVNTLTAADAQRVTLVAAKTPPQPQGKAIYLRRKGSLIFLANNLAPLPPQRIYELWLIPPAGSPVPAGLFKPDARGSATLVNPPLPQGMEAKAFAITVEPEAGSAAPTSTPIMLGAGE